MRASSWARSFSPSTFLELGLMLFQPSPVPKQAIGPSRPRWRFALCENVPAASGPFSCCPLPHLRLSLPGPENEPTPQERVPHNPTPLCTLQGQKQGHVLFFGAQHSPATFTRLKGREGVKEKRNPGKPVSVRTASHLEGLQLAPFS